MRKFKVNVRGTRYRYFATIEDATAYCSAVFERSGVVLAIEAA